MISSCDGETTVCKCTLSIGKGPNDSPFHQKYKFIRKGWISRKAADYIKQTFQGMLKLWLRFENNGLGWKGP